MPQAFLLFSLGFFLVGAQTLLFRDFFRACAGNELLLTTFFIGWFMWAAAGGVLLRLFGKRIGAELLRAFAVLPLLTVPCFLLQHHLLSANAQLYARATQSLLPMPAILPRALLHIAPLSLLSGILLGLAGSWYQRQSTSTSALTNAYALSTLGSAVGALTTTLMLALHLLPETIFLYGAILPALAGCWNSHKRQHLYAALFTVLAITGTLLFGWQHDWTQLHARDQWQQSLSELDYVGSFSTSHGSYDFASGNNLFLVSTNNRMIDVWPNDDAAAEVAALTLAQHPDARRVLLIGDNGLSLSKMFLHICESITVTWLHPDPAYPEEAMRLAPEPLPSREMRLTAPGKDIREFIQAKQSDFDLIIVNLSAANTLYLKRLTTLPFYADLHQALAGDGIIAVRIADSGDIDLFTLSGAQIYSSLDRSFAEVVVKPGAASWVLAGKHKLQLTTDGMELRRRLRRIANSHNWFDAEALLSMFPPPATSQHHKTYARLLQHLGSEQLINRDPSTLLPRISEHSSSRKANLLLTSGGTVAGSALVLLMAMTTLLCCRRRNRAAPGSALPVLLMLFATAAISMVMVVVLMLLFQTRFGGLFFYIGLFLGLFMFGMFSGNRIARRCLSNWLQPRRLTALSLIAYLLLPLLLYLNYYQLTAAGIALSILLTGIFAGGAIPIVEHQLSSGRIRLDNLDTIGLVDNLGAMLGAGIVLLLF